jgi:tetratricopeptide (TPR) repeat protein
MLLAVVVALPLAGCASRDAAGKGKHGAAQARRSAPRSQFETSRDPPIAPDTRYAAGQLAESRGALPQAAEQYRQALRDNPKHVEAMYRLGVVYAGMKKFPEAIEVWKKYTQATSDSAAGYSNLGFCYELAGKPEEAEAAYLKGIRRDPKHVASRVNYGLMLVRRGRVNEGTLQLQAVLTPAEVHYNLGSVYETLGRPEQAKAEYKQALKLDPALADAQSRLEEVRGH